jgi:Mrp family chromosome partitioning ATPase
MTIQGNLARADHGDQLSRKHEFRELELRVPEDLPVVDLVELYTGIETVLEPDRCVLLQLIGAGADCTAIALDLAWTGASVLGKRVLLLNCSPSGCRLLTVTGSDAKAAKTARASEDVMVKVAGQQIYMVDIVGNPRDAAAAHAVDTVSSFFDTYCAFLDMVIVVPPPAEIDPLGTVMARHVDGNIMVIEADHTRRAEAVRLREVLVRSGRPLIGAILNNRQNHLPRWMARIL